MALPNGTKPPDTIATAALKYPGVQMPRFGNGISNRAM